jgi:serine/threonine protein kinase
LAARAHCASPISAAPWVELIYDANVSEEHPELSGMIERRFQIHSRAGAGGMGEVYRALDWADQKMVALKVLHSEARQQLHRFAREAKLLEELNHPAIVRFVSHGTLPDGRPFLVMEWLEGVPLSRRLKHQLLTIGETLTVAAGIADALGAAHAMGVVHRDLKPANIHLVDSSIEQPKLLDFGIASARGTHAELTDTRAILGTPGYMAPEQIQSSKYAGPPADVFSLGCVMFKCLTGRVPYEGKNTVDVIVSMMTRPPLSLSELRHDATRPLEGLLSRMLDRDPANRPQTGQEISQLLDNVAADRALQGIASIRPPPPPPRSSRRSALDPGSVDETDSDDEATRVATKAFESRDGGTQVIVPDRNDGKQRND